MRVARVWHGPPLLSPVASQGTFGFWLRCRARPVHHDAAFLHPMHNFPIVPAGKPASHPMYLPGSTTFPFTANSNTTADNQHTDDGTVDPCMTEPNLNVKRAIRSRETNLWLATGGSWTEDFSRAQLFQSVTEAVGVSIQLQLQCAEVVIRFEGDHLPDIATPL